VKALVTGSAGFIGTHLVAKLRDSGSEVSVCDLSYGTDLTRPGAALEAVKGQDIVFHLAADSKVGGAPGSDLNDHTKDLGGPAMMMNLLTAMKAEGVPKMVFVSSAAVYGDTKILPTPETAPTLPISLYGAAKLSAESFARAFMNLAPIDIAVFRLGNPVGVGTKKGVVWEFFQRLEKDQTRLEILGDAKMTRAFFDVEDCVEGLIEGAKVKGFDVFNLAATHTLTIEETAEIIVEEMGLDGVKLTFAGGDRGWPGDVRHSWPSVEKAYARLGWYPKLTPEQAIRKAVRWMMEIPA
jgi:UDP-glucose 4-epimerase